MWPRKWRSNFCVRPTGRGWWGLSSAIGRAGPGSPIGHTCRLAGSMRQSAEPGYRWHREPTGRQETAGAQRRHGDLTRRAALGQRE